MLIKLYDDNINTKDLESVVAVLKKDGVIVYPTDSVYAIGCSILSVKAVQHVARLKDLDPKKSSFSIICSDLSMAASYAKISNNIFKAMKNNLPGPFTFILPASGKLPNIMLNKRRTVGIRIPDNYIAKSIVEELGNPIITTSVRKDDMYDEYMTDPDLIHEKYESLVDLVVDGGIGNMDVSAILDCTDESIEIIREGIKKFNY